MIVGRYDVGASQFILAADTKRTARLTVPEARNVAKGSVYLDGLGGGLGSQVARLVIYSAAGVLLGFSDEVTVQNAQAAGWVDFPFSLYGGGLSIPAGDIFVGLQGGLNTQVIRMYGSDPHGAGGQRGNDAYADGPSDPFGTAIALTADLTLFLTLFQPYTSVVPVETDIYLSRLPLQDAQETLGMTGPDANVAQRLADVGWHGTFLDPETGSNALVRDTSPLMGLLGERVKVTVPGVVPRSVFAYVHNVADAAVIDWDLSLTRSLYAQIAMLGEETTTCVIEVLN